MIRSLRKYVVELDGARFSCAKGKLQEIDDLNAISGDNWFISDMQESISRTMTVDVVPRYADVIAQKQVQESGEFEGSVTLIPHWRKQKGKNTTDIFFTAIPAHLSSQYLASGGEHDDNIILFPIYSVLYGLLRRIRAKGPIALIFQHGRFADMIIGSKKKIYYANRSVAFDSKEVHLVSLWETIKEDIKNVEKANRIEVVKSHLITWIDSGDLSVWAQDPERDLQLFKSESVTLNGEVHQTSLFKALQRLTAFDSVAPPAEKSLYYTKRWAPWLNLAFVAAIIMLIGGYFSYQQKAAQLQTISSNLDRKIAGTRLEAPLSLNKEKLEQTFKLATDLYFCRKAASYKNVINHVSDAISSDLSLEVLKLDYRDDAIYLKLYGRVSSSFRRAQKEYRDFMTKLKQQGYMVEESRFDTDIKNSKFLINLKKIVK